MEQEYRSGRGVDDLKIAEEQATLDDLVLLRH